MEQHHELCKDGVVITMTHNQETAWDSDADNACSISSTPYKQGLHQQKKTPPWEEDPLTLQAIDELEREYGQTREHVKHPGAPSVHTRVANWLGHDAVCIVDYHPGWKLRKWMSALRSEIVCMSCFTVVLYLEKVQEFEDVPPHKNGLQVICKIIRQHKKGTRIFISNLLPTPSKSPDETTGGDTFYTSSSSVQCELGYVQDSLSLHL